MTTKPNRGPGRPSVPANRRKAPPVTFSIRMTEAEAAAVRKTAAKRNLSIQEFLVRGGLHYLRLSSQIEEAERARAAGLL